MDGIPGIAVHRYDDDDDDDDGRKKRERRSTTATATATATTTTTTTTATTTRTTGTLRSADGHPREMNSRGADVFRLFFLSFFFCFSPQRRLLAPSSGRYSAAGGPSTSGTSPVTPFRPRYLFSSLSDPYLFGYLFFFKKKKIKKPGPIVLPQPALNSATTLRFPSPFADCIFCFRNEMEYRCHRPPSRHL